MVHMFQTHVDNIPLIQKSTALSHRVKKSFFVVTLQPHGSHCTTQQQQKKMYGLIYYLTLYMPEVIYTKSVVLLQLGAALMSVACVTTEGQACPWSVLLSRAMRMSMVHVVPKGLV